MHAPRALTWLVVGCTARIVTVGALVLALAGCHSKSSEASERSDAMRVVAAVLADAKLPSGARPFNGTPAPLLRSPAMQPQGDPNLVTRSVFWTTAQAPTAVVASLTATMKSETGFAPTTSTLGQSGRTVVWSLTDYPAKLSTADVARVERVESVTASGRGSMIRVDAMADWYTPRGSDERVPASDHVVTLTSRATIGAAAASQPPKVIVVTDAATVTRLAGMFNHLQVDVVSGSGCGLNDDGVQYTIEYRATRAATPDVVVSGRQCGQTVKIHGHLATRLNTIPLTQAVAKLFAAKH
jgi:hypothetical protein